MVGIDAILFGYRIISPEEGGELRLANSFLRIGVSAEGRYDGSFVIREADYKAFKAYAGGRVRYTASALKGLPAHFMSLRWHIPELVAAIASVFLVIFLSGLVWDIRVDGNDTLPSDELISAVESAGLGIGASWDKIDPEAIEASLLSSVPYISWVQINRIGTVAYVSVIERAQTEEDSSPPYEFANIVASCDGVVEEITVAEGEAAVKVGDVVRRGQLLISGAVSSERGSYFTVAEGSVIAHTAGGISAEVGLSEAESTVTEDGIAGVCLRVLGSNINIFKKYGNSDSECVIIEDEEDCLYIMGKKIPISLVYKRRYLASERVVFNAESDLPTLAGERLEHMLRDALRDADLIKLKTTGRYADGGYIITAEYVIARDIGEPRELKVDGN